jgi:hypothetical protein
MAASASCSPNGHPPTGFEKVQRRGCSGRSPESSHFFQPLLYQVATSVLAPSEVAAPMRHLARKQRNLIVVTQIRKLQPISVG